MLNETFSVIFKHVAYIFTVYPPTAYDTLTFLDFFMGHIQRRIYSWCRSSSEDSFANKLCRDLLFSYKTSFHFDIRIFQFMFATTFLLKNIFFESKIVYNFFEIFCLNFCCFCDFIFSQIKANFCHFILCYYKKNGERSEPPARGLALAEGAVSANIIYNRNFRRINQK